MVKNRRISFHMHSLSSAELKHNYSWVLLVGRGRRYLMTCWKTVTPGWKLHSKLSRHFQSNAAKKRSGGGGGGGAFPMFGLMVSEPAVCTESGWERFLGIFKELCCTAESCFLGPALQWKCYCSRTLKHVRPSGAQQGLWSQTLFSSPMLRLPSLTFLGISEEFCSQFLIKACRETLAAARVCKQDWVLPAYSSTSSKYFNICQNGSLYIYEL